MQRDRRDDAVGVLSASGVYPAIGLAFSVGWDEQGRSLPPEHPAGRAARCWIVVDREFRLEPETEAAEGPRPGIGAVPCAATIRAQSGSSAREGVGAEKEATIRPDDPRGRETFLPSPWDVIGRALRALGVRGRRLGGFPAPFPIGVRGAPRPRAETGCAPRW